MTYRDWMDFRGTLIYESNPTGVERALYGRVRRARFTCDCGEEYTAKGKTDEDAAERTAGRISADTDHLRECGW